MILIFTVQSYKEHISLCLTIHCAFSCICLKIKHISYVNCLSLTRSCITGRREKLGHGRISVYRSFHEEKLHSLESGVRAVQKGEHTAAQSDSVVAFQNILLSVSYYQPQVRPGSKDMMEVLVRNKSYGSIMELENRKGSRIHDFWSSICKMGPH